MTKRTDPNKLVITTEIAGSVWRGDTLYVKPHARLAGYTLKTVSVTDDVEWTPRLESWLKREIWPRMEFPEDEAK